VGKGVAREFDGLGSDLPSVRGKTYFVVVGRKGTGPKLVGRNEKWERENGTKRGGQNLKRIIPITEIPPQTIHIFDVRSVNSY